MSGTDNLQAKVAVFQCQQQAREAYNGAGCPTLSPAFGERVGSKSVLSPRDSNFSIEVGVPRARHKRRSLRSEWNSSVGMTIAGSRALQDVIRSPAASAQRPYLLPRSGHGEASLFNPLLTTCSMDSRSFIAGRSVSLTHRTSLTSVPALASPEIGRHR